MLLGIACSACHTQAVRTLTSKPETNVAYQSIAAPASARYQLQPSESAKQPILIEQPAPEYPPGMIPLNLAEVTVHARIVVDANGKVTAVHIAHDAAVLAYPEAFDDSVRTTVNRWRYSPLQFLRWRDEYDAQGNLVNSRKVAVESKPFSLDYEFTFTLHNGKPVVASANPSSQ